MSFETSVGIHLTAGSYIADDRTRHCHRSENFKSNKNSLVWREIEAEKKC
jgi:hypothetical protein